MTMGDGFNFHTPHWHGNMVMVDKHRRYVVSLAPAQFVVAEMVSDNVGRWMFHCHLSDHMSRGVMTDYGVLP
jgi:hephaestin